MEVCTLPIIFRPFFLAPLRSASLTRAERGTNAVGAIEFMRIALTGGFESG